MGLLRSFGVVLVSIKVAAIAAFAGLVVVVVLAVAGDSQVEPPRCSAECDTIPPVALEAYDEAAESDGCNGVDWTILAGIGQVESRHGTLFGGRLDEDGRVSPPLFGPELDGSGVGGNTTPMPSGEWRGQYGLGEWMRAVGPMQFLPSTWDIYGDGGDPQSIFDSARAAARLLCASMEKDGDIKNAIHSYNRSWDYVAKVLHQAAIYGRWEGPATHVDAGLLDNDRVCLTEYAKEDLRDGIVDPRLVVFLEAMAARWEYCISILRTGHAPCVINTGVYPDCRVSNHWYGRGVDISSVNKQLVTPGNSAAREVVDWIARNQDHGNFPDSVGSPWAEAFGFTDDLHQDHLHIAFYSDGLLDPTGITEKPTPRPARADNTAKKVSFTFPGIEWETAADPKEWDDVWEEPLPGLSPGLGGGGGVDDVWTPDTNYTAPEEEHDPWSRPVKDPTDDKAHEGHKAEADLIPLQPLVDATPLGGVLRLEAHRYTGATLTRPISIVGPRHGNAFIIERHDTHPALGVAAFGPVSIEDVTIEGGAWAIQAQFTRLRVVDVTVTRPVHGGVEVRGGSAFMSGVDMFGSGGDGIAVWGAQAVIEATAMRTGGGAGIYASGGASVAVRDSSIISVGGAGVDVGPRSVATIERSFIGATGGGGVAASGDAHVRNSALWGGSWAFRERGSGVIAEYANAVVGGSIEAAWSREGVRGEAARQRLGAPWIVNDEPTSRAEQAIRSLVDLRVLSSPLSEETGWPAADAGWPDWPRISAS